jgi:hypothetical protein
MQSPLSRGAAVVISEFTIEKLKILSRCHTKHIIERQKVDRIRQRKNKVKRLINSRNRMDLRTRSRFVGMAVVGFFDEAAGGDVGDGFPWIIQFRISFPLNEILDTASHRTGVKDIFDFKMLMFVFNIERRKRWRQTIWIEGG